MRNKYLFGTFLVIAFFAIVAASGGLIEKPLFRGLVRFTAGEKVDFLDNTMTWANDNDIQIGSATVRTEDIHLAGSAKLYNVNNSNGDGTITYQVRNGGTGGADISAGDVVALDQNLHQLGADTTAAKPFRITFDIDDFGGLWQAKWTHGGTSDADTVTVTGTDVDGTAQIDTLVLTGGNSTAYGHKWFATITAASAAKTSASGTQELDVVLLNGAKAMDGANGDRFGVAIEVIADSGGTGMVVISGPAKATVDAATLNATPGILLQGASGGDAVTIAAALADSTANGKILGYALESSVSNNQLIWIFVDKQ